MSTAAQTRRLLAPAKLNLGLRILGRRSDGYHLIESLFVPIDLADEVAVSLTGAGERGGGRSKGAASAVAFSLIEEPGALGAERLGRVPADGANLAAEAARRFLAQTGVERLVRVSLRKRIPVGAGMGGGSSDAGAVLRALADACGVSKTSLGELALGLGADVPYFLDPCPAVVSGVGEQIEPVEGFPRLALLLLNPGISLATADVFRAFDRSASSLTLARPGSTMRALSGLRGDLDRFSRKLEELLVNDLEPAAVRLCPQIAVLREQLGELGAEATGMSGSGATVFGLFPSMAAAQEALEKAAFAPPVWARVAEVAGTE